jgi:hypothetical protein
MKFKDLAVGSRFYVDEYGWSRTEIYTKLDEKDNMSCGWNAQNDDGSRTSIDENDDVVRLGPKKDSELGEAIHNYIKENLTIQIESFGLYEFNAEKGIKVSLSLGGEVISEAKLRTWEYLNDD